MVEANYTPNPAGLRPANGSVKCSWLFLQRNADGQSQWIQQQQQWRSIKLRRFKDSQTGVRINYANLLAAIAPLLAHQAKLK